MFAFGYMCTLLFNINEIEVLLYPLSSKTWTNTHNHFYQAQKKVISSIHKKKIHKRILLKLSKCKHQKTCGFLEMFKQLITCHYLSVKIIYLSHNQDKHSDYSFCGNLGFVIHIWKRVCVQYLVRKASWDQFSTMASQKLMLYGTAMPSSSTTSTPLPIAST